MKRSLRVDHLTLYITAHLLVTLIGCGTRPAPAIYFDTLGSVGGRQIAFCFIPDHLRSSSSPGVWISRKFDMIPFQLNKHPHPLTPQSKGALPEFVSPTQLHSSHSSPVLDRSSVCHPTQPLPLNKILKISIPNSQIPLEIASWGWRWGREIRRSPYRIYDAKIDLKQEKIYLVGEGGLWVWSLGQRSIQPLSVSGLPPPPFSRVLKDGGYWWVRTSDRGSLGMGYPIDLYNKKPKRVGPPHPLPITPNTLLIPLAKSPVRLERGRLNFEWRDHLYPSAPINDVALIDNAHIAIATSQSVDIWRVFHDFTPLKRTSKLESALKDRSKLKKTAHSPQKKGGLRRVFTLPLHSPTQRLIFHKNHLYMIGESYGILWVKMSKKTSKPQAE